MSGSKSLLQRANSGDVQTMDAAQMDENFNANASGLEMSMAAKIVSPFLSAGGLQGIFMTLIFNIITAMEGAGLSTIGQGILSGGGQSGKVEITGSTLMGAPGKDNKAYKDGFIYGHCHVQYSGSTEGRAWIATSAHTPAKVRQAYEGNKDVKKTLADAAIVVSQANGVGYAETGGKAKVVGLHNNTLFMCIMFVSFHLVRKSAHVKALTLGMGAGWQKIQETFLEQIDASLDAITAMGDETLNFLAGLSEGIYAGCIGSEGAAIARKAGYAKKDAVLMFLPLKTLTESGLANMGSDKYKVACAHENFLGMLNEQDEFGRHCALFTAKWAGFHGSATNAEARREKKMLKSRIVQYLLLSPMAFAANAHLIEEMIKKGVS
jgi:hypothetical protein